MYVENLHLEREASSDLNGLFRDLRMTGMVEGEVYECVDMELAFLAALINHVTGLFGMLS